MRLVTGFVAALGAALLVLAVLQDALQVLHRDHTRMVSTALGASGLLCLCAALWQSYRLEQAAAPARRVAQVYD